MTGPDDLAGLLAGGAKPASGGFFTLQEAAAWLGRVRYVEVGFFERVGRRAALLEPPPVAVWAEAASLSASWRARMIEELLPVSVGLPGPAELTRSAGDAVDAALDRLGASPLAGPRTGAGPRGEPPAGDPDAPGAPNRAPAGDPDTPAAPNGDPPAGDPPAADPDTPDAPGGAPPAVDPLDGLALVEFVARSFYPALLAAYERRQASCVPAPDGPLGRVLARVIADLEAELKSVTDIAETPCRPS